MRFPLTSLFGIPLLLSSIASAQTATPQQSGVIEPGVTGIGRKMQVGRREIEIHHQGADQSTGSVSHYFHWPLLLLDDNPSPIDGLPDIVFRQRNLSDLTYLTFHVILSNPEFRKDALAFVIANAPEFREPGNNAQPSTTIIDPWPITTLIVKVRDSDNRDHILGSWTSDSLQASGDIIDVSVPFTADELTNFKSLSNSGDLDFAFSYTYTNVRSQYAVAVSHADQSIGVALSNAVTSSNISPNSPIFQDQANEFVSKLDVELTTVYSANSADLIPFVKTDLLDHYLTGKTIDVKSVQDEKLSEAIYAYLQPLLQKAADKRTQQDTTTSSHDNGVTVDLKGAQGPLSLGVNKSDMDKIGTEHGVTFEQSDDHTFYAPSSIKVYSISQISDQQTFNIVQRAFLTQGGDKNFIADTPVPASFTRNSVTFGSTYKAANFEGVLPGMAFCYLGKEVPGGYVEVDQSSGEWPTSSWVPDQLQGKPFPSIQGLLIGSSHNVSDVGTVAGDGSLTLPAFAVPAAGLSPVVGGGENYVISPNNYSDSFNLAEHIQNGKIVSFANGPSGDYGPELTKMEFVTESKVVSIAGSASVAAMSIQVGTGGNPPNIRCRLIVKE